jgi:hypothetical protein
MISCNADCSQPVKDEIMETPAATPSQARHFYKTARFTDEARRLVASDAPGGFVRVKYFTTAWNAFYDCHEDVYACYSGMTDDTLIGTFFERALHNFVL